jgi:hypothetical protein
LKVLASDSASLEQALVTVVPVETMNAMKPAS